MPKAFESKQLELIKNNLLIKGKELFSTYGYKKIGIRELTKEVGIASGMFYKLYKSKDELFFIILEIEQSIVRTKIFKEMLKYKDEPKRALKNFYYIIIDELTLNPLLRIISENNEYKEIIDKISESKMVKEKTDSLNLYNELTTYWNDNNLVNNIDINIIIESLRSIVYLWFHRTEIGLDRYDDIIEYIINKVCEF